MKLRLDWSFGNSKVKKLAAVSFGLPAYRSADGFVTCPRAGACAAVCYARQGHYLVPVVSATRERNLKAVRHDVYQFSRDAVADLERIPNRLVRVHDSGDFFSQEYLDAWFQIARLTPGKIFYAYTKSLDLDFSSVPSNFKITQSEGGLLDSRIDRRRSHSRIFATDSARRRAGYGDGSHTDTLAIRGARKIGLVYHGNRHLTPAQSKHFGG